MNPYKALPIYTPAILSRFRGKNRPEMAPHAYMVAETAFQQMVDDEENQVCVARAPC